MKPEDTIKFLRGWIYPKVSRKEIEEGTKYTVRWPNGSKVKVQLDNDAPFSREIGTFLDSFLKKEEKTSWEEPEL